MERRPEIEAVRRDVLGQSVDGSRNISGRERDDCSQDGFVFRWCELMGSVRQGFRRTAVAVEVELQACLKP